MQFLQAANPAVFACGLESLVAKCEDLGFASGELVGGRDEVNGAVQAAGVVVIVTVG
ncbi:MAG: hypothetical protein HC882_03565 [Acidobacteria bacterium]|nr:hypothetical protein [Acidobacteriota bacterium]